MRRYYLAPAVAKAAPGEAEALYLLMKIAGLGGTSRLYQKLVVEDKVASSAGGWYSRHAASTAAPSASTAWRPRASRSTRSSRRIDRVVHDLRENGVTEAELERAKKQFIAEFVYESDSQETLARRYGSGLALGMTIDQINSWPASYRQGHGGPGEAGRAKYLDIRRSVTGTLDSRPPPVRRARRAGSGAAAKQELRRGGDDVRASCRRSRMRLASMAHARVRWSWRLRLPLDANPPAKRRP